MLLNKRISVKRRLSLFDSTVGGCVLYGCQSWTPRAEEFRHLESTRRAMLRRIAGARRAPEEPWVEWIMRVTRKALELARSARVRHWGEEHLRGKWMWAGHVARRPTSTWVWKVTSWRDSMWQSLAQDSGTQRELRPSTRRWMKWEDVLRRFCHLHGHGQWQVLGSQRELWADQVEAFSEP